MKVISLIASFTFFTNFIFGQKVIFNIKYSEPLAVFVFVKELSPNTRENAFKTAFRQSKYDTESYQKLITELDTLMIYYSYSFTEFPYSSKTPGMTDAFLKKNLIAAHDLKDFKQRSIGLIPNTTIFQLSNILSLFTPIYKELIFNPNQKQFDNQLKNIEKYVTDKNIVNYFETGLTFYNSTWDASIPFEMAFYPLPNSQGFTAEAFFNNTISAIQTDLKNYNTLLSVMLHEIFHILYDEQSLAVKTTIANHFQQNPSKCSNYAYLLMNEVLATALGNGYVYEKLNGKNDNEEWYHWKYIDLMAKAIYPMIAEYVSHKKPIDKIFIDNYIEKYEQNFSNWITEKEHIMTYRYILSENKDDFDLFRKIFPYCSMSETESTITEAQIEKMKLTPITKIIMVSKNHKKQLEILKKQFPELQKWRYEAHKEFLYSIFLKDKTHLFIINQIETPTERLLKKLGFASNPY